MCFRGPTINIPDPPPLAPPPPPPAPPKAPLPEQAPVETDINPQVKEDKTKKTKNEMSQGTSELRIPLDTEVSIPGHTGGIN